MTFLLIRNGGKVYQVYSELGTHYASRLFPTKDEMEKPFSGIRGETITVNDIRFADAREKHDNIALHYRRLLILTCGLHDRLHLFGDLPVPGAGPLELFQMENQKRAFRFVYDGESNLLGDGRPDFRQWMLSKNDFLRSGSRVMCVWEHVMTPKSCPAAVESEGHSYGSYFRYRPVEESGIAIAYREKEEICVKINVTGRTGWHAKNDERNFNARVSLNKCGSTRDFLVLDAVSSEELDYYILSRENRVDYLEYIPTLAVAREFLRQEEKTEFPAKEAIKTSLIEGRIIDSVRDASLEIDEVVRKWRAANRGRTLPSPADIDYHRVVTTLLDQLYVIFGHGRNRAEAAAELVNYEGRVPLRLVITGNKKLVIYATPLEEEREDRISGHVWVQRIVLEEKKTKVSIIGRKWQVLPEKTADETVLYEWPDAKDWAGLRANGGLSYEQARGVFTAIENAAENILSLLGPHDDEKFGRLLTWMREQTDILSKKYVCHPIFRVPIGLLEKPAVLPRQGSARGEYPGAPAEYYLLMLEGESPSVLYRNATPEQRTRIEKWFRRKYRHPEHALSGLDTAFDIVTMTDKLAVASLSPFNCGESHSGRRLNLELNSMTSDVILEATKQIVRQNDGLRVVVMANL